MTNGAAHPAATRSRLKVARSRRVRVRRSAAAEQRTKARQEEHAGPSVYTARAEAVVEGMDDDD